MGSTKNRHDNPKLPVLTLIQLKSRIIPALTRGGADLYPPEAAAARRKLSTSSYIIIPN